MLKGKKLSVLGDSISTYRGVSNDASANKTLFYNPWFHWYSGQFSVDKTYWKRVIDKFGLELCINNSWSGGNLSGMDNPDSGVNRAKNLARDDGEMPDIVIVFMGINDLGRNVSSQIFQADYQRTLEIIKKDYNDPYVCCVNLPDRDALMKKRTAIFNEIISNSVEKMGEKFFVADLFNSRLNNDFYYDNTVDGIHPDEDGMKIIAEVITDAIRKNCN